MKVPKSIKLLEEVRDYRPTSSPADLEAFISGSIHEDFVNEVIARIEQMRDFNEECSSKEYLETRGGIKALRMMLDIFPDLLANRLADLEHESQEVNDEEDV